MRGYDVLTCLWPAFLAIGAIASAAARPRSEWYRDTIVNLHIDNHSGLVGKGFTTEQLAAMVRDIPVTMIQVSAFGANGVTTYPTAICPHPGLGDWDTLAAWRGVTRTLGRRFCIYINTRGLGLPKEHPEWMQRDAQGKGKGRNGGLDVCARPSADRRGVLERVLLPMLNEIVTRYKPDGVWVDGDHARTPVCYCENCRAAWEEATGKRPPPATPSDPDWPKWLALEQQRLDGYRRQMARAVHTAHPQCMYTSNHSWRFKSKDPRSAPDFADTLSGDLSHGPALRLTRLSAMALSPDEEMPHDIMHNTANIQRRPACLRRILQQGALTLACGGPWFLWVPGSSIVRKAAQDRAKACAEFAVARRAALGPTASLAQVAVLLSETSWHRQHVQGKQGAYGTAAPEHLALALQDTGLAVDIVNEAILRSHANRYRIVVVANQQRVATATLSTLQSFVEAGGMLVLAGSALIENSDEPGVAQCAATRELRGRRTARLGDGRLPFPSAWAAPGRKDDVRAAFDDGTPLLVTRAMGRGTVARLAAATLPYPDDEGLAVWLLHTLGVGPSVAIEGDARDRHLVFALRRKAGHAVLHVTDLTSFVKGKRIVPTTQNLLDDEPPMPRIELSLPLSAKPKRVACVPAATSVSHRWADGVLHLTLEHVHVHAAVAIEGPIAEPWPLLPTTVPVGRQPAVPTAIAEDFETAPVGGPPPEGLGVARVAGKTSIRVTDETAASGRRCLKFTDHPDAPRPFHPYFFLRPAGLSRGAGILAFDLRLDRGAAVQVELREVENAREFPVGPSLVFRAGGELRAAGRPDALASLPVGQWFHVEVTFALDGAARYDLTLQLPGKPPQVFKGLPCRSPDFWRCGWAGFIGIASAQTAFYIDNVRLGTITKGKEE